MFKNGDKAKVKSGEHAGKVVKVENTDHDGKVSVVTEDNRFSFDVDEKDLEKV